MSWFRPPLGYFTERFGRCFFCGPFVFFLSCVCCAFVYVCLLAPCGRLLGAGLLALVCGVSLCVCHFHIGILGQVWYLIVSIPDLCILTYFKSFLRKGRL